MHEPALLLPEPPRDLAVLALDAVPDLRHRHAIFVLAAVITPSGDPINMGGAVSRTFPVIDGLDTYFFRVGEGMQRFAISD